MTIHEIAAGDEEEFALLITDPVTGDPVDMADHPDWEVWVAIGGTTIVKSFQDGDLPINASHPDPDAPDGSLRLVLSQAETAALAAGSHRIYAKLRDSSGVEQTILYGTEHDIQPTTTPLSAL